MAEYKAHQDYKSDSADNRYTGGNGFCYPAESQLESAPGQGRSSKKEHSGIHNQ